MASLIDLCNQALDEIGKAHIGSLGETSIEAQKCTTFAQPLLNEMPDWSDEIPLGRTRVVLPSVTNDRPAEWLYAYASPADMGKPIAIRAVEDNADFLPVSGPYTFPLQDAEPLAFVAEDDKVYTNVETATLIYTRNSIDVSELSALMQRAFVLELATRLAAPVAKWDADKITAKGKQAEMARQRAIAAEENKTRRVQPRYVSEAEYARFGL